MKPTSKNLHWILLLSSVSWTAVALQAASLDSSAFLPGSDNDIAIILLIGFVSLALIVSFMCSVAETVLLSITPAYIESLRQKHPRRAARLRQLRQEKVDRSLAAILTMNTVAHTVGAIEAGAQSAIVFGSTWVGLFSAIMTLMILFFSEIIPKTLGAIYWPRLTGVTTWYIRTLIFLMYPLVLASEGITRLITRNKTIHNFSRDEFIAMAGIGKQSGEIDEQELRIIHNLFRFRSLKITDIMTPRTVISALPESMSVAEARQIAVNKAFSRLPVYNKDADDITGFVLKDELLMPHNEAAQRVRLKEMKRPIQCVPDSILLPRVLEQFLQQRLQIVMVVDEYGQIKGLVTLEDVIETLLGMEIIDEMDSVADMQAWARQQWARRAAVLGVELSDEVLQQGAKEGDNG